MMLVTLGRGMSPVVGGVFSPSFLQGCVLWLDAADLGTITEVGDSVSAWADKSGQGNDAGQSNGAYQPATGANTMNGKNVLTFNEDYLKLDSPISVRTVFFVINDADGQTGNSAATSVLGKNNAAIDSSNYIFVRSNSPDSDYDISIDGTSGATGTASANQSAPVHGTNIDLGRTNAENEAETLWTVIWDVNHDQDLIGGSFYTNVNPAKVKLAELIIYNRALTSAEVAKVENYLMNKWGL